MTDRRSLPLAADLYGDLLDVAPAAPVGLKAYFPGLALTTVAALAAAYLSEHYGAPIMLMPLSLPATKLTTARPMNSTIGA